MLLRIEGGVIKIVLFCMNYAIKGNRTMNLIFGRYWNRCYPLMNVGRNGFMLTEEQITTLLTIYFIIIANKNNFIRRSYRRIFKNPFKRRYTKISLSKQKKVQSSLPEIWYFNKTGKIPPQNYNSFENKTERLKTVKPKLVEIVEKTPKNNRCNHSRRENDLDAVYCKYCGLQRSIGG